MVRWPPCTSISLRNEPHPSLFVEGCESVGDDGLVLYYGRTAEPEISYEQSIRRAPETACVRYAVKTHKHPFSQREMSAQPSASESERVRVPALVVVVAAELRVI
jgi:hypothetical protein